MMTFLTLLTGKYGKLAFGAIGLVAVFAILLIAFKFFKKKQKEFSEGESSLNKSRPAKSEINNSIKQIKTRLTESSVPAFIYIHDGATDSALDHLFQFLDKSVSDVYFDDPMQPIVVSEQQVILLAQLDNLAKLDINRFNLLLDKLYKQGVIQLPNVAIQLKQKPNDSGLTTSLYRFLPRINLLAKQPYQVHFLSDNSPIKGKIGQLLEVDNAAPYVDFSHCQSPEELEQYANQHFNSLRDQFSTYMSQDNVDSQKLASAMSASHFVERYLKQITPVISGFFEPELVKQKPQCITLNYGADPSNYRSQFFYSGSDKTGRRISGKHIAVSSLCIASLLASVGIVYNGVQKIQLDDAIKQASPFVPQTLPLVTAEQNYQRWSGLYRSKLILGSLYPTSIEKNLNQQYASYLLVRLNTQYQEAHDPLNRSLYLMIFAANHDAKIRAELKKYQSLLTQLTGFSSQQLNLVYSFANQPVAQISTLGLNTSNIGNQLEVSNTLMANVMSSNQVLGQLFNNIQLNITNQQLLSLLNQSVVMQQKLAVLHDTIPQSLASVYQAAMIFLVT